MQNMREPKTGTERQHKYNIEHKKTCTERMNMENLDHLFKQLVSRTDDYDGDDDETYSYQATNIHLYTQY